MSKDDLRKDDVKITKFQEPIDIRIRVTPEIHTVTDNTGLCNSLHFKIECDGEIAPGPFYHWHHRYNYYGEREGQVWEEVKADWLAQYHYVLETIKFALMRKADTLCGESAVAQWHNVDWDSFFSEVYDHMHELNRRFAERFPPERGEGSYSNLAWARMEVMNLITSDAIDTDCRLVETPVAESEEAKRTLETHTKDHIRKRRKLKRFLYSADIAIKRIASQRKPGQRSGLPIERFADVLNMGTRTLRNLYEEFTGLEDEMLNRLATIQDGETNGTAKWVTTVLDRLGMG